MFDNRNVSCAAVVVSYNPAGTLLENVSALLSELPAVTVVDNGSDPATASTLEQLTALSGCTVQRLGANQGIAAALNSGVRYLMEGGYTYIFTFDQDSSIEPGFVAAMLDTLSQSPDPSRVAIVAPMCLDRNFSFHLKLPRTRSGEILEAIASGSLITSSTFSAVGLFNEDFFMDYVDIEFCLRCRRVGLRIVESSSAILHHSIGRMVPRRFLGIRCYPSNHSAARRYYVFRNRIYLMLRYRSDWAWILRQQRAAALEILKIVFLEDHSLAKLSSIVRGVTDGFAGRLGKRVEL